MPRQHLREGPEPWIWVLSPSRPEGQITEYSPIDSQRPKVATDFRTLAAYASADMAAWRAFANRWGLLGIAREFYGGNVVGESAYSWAIELVNFWQAVERWTALGRVPSAWWPPLLVKVKNQDEISRAALKRAQEEIFEISRATVKRAAEEAQASRSGKPVTPLRPTRQECLELAAGLSRAMSSALDAHTSLAVTANWQSTTGRPQFHLEQRPKNLLGAIWLHLARTLTRDEQVARWCENGCGKRLDVTGLGGRKRRKDARFCSDLCRATFFSKTRR